MKSNGFMDKALGEFLQWKDQKKLNIATFQEHNLDPKDEDDLIRKAKVKYITLIIGFAKKASDGVHRGGVLIMCDDTTITHTSTKIKEGGIVKVDLVWGGKNIEFAGIYAPAQALERVNFLQTLRNKINKNTITGGDWNLSLIHI